LIVQKGGEQKEYEQIQPEEVGERYFPKPSTMSDYYHNCTRMHGHRLRKKNRQVGYQMLRDRGEDRLYVDFDSKVHPSDNESAEYTYQKINGYHPFYVTAPNQKLALDHYYRPGSAAPQRNYKGLVRTHLKQAKDSGLKRVEATLDCAGWQVEVIKTFNRYDAMDGFSADVYTRPGKPADEDDMKESVVETIQAIDEQEWEKVEIYYADGRKRFRKLSEKQEREEGKQVIEMAETTYTISNQQAQQTVRLVATRQEKEKKQEGQKRLVNVYHYKPFATTDWETPMLNIPEKYNRRGGAEDVIGEIVEDGDADRFPFDPHPANALYLGTNAAAYNLVKQQEWLMDEIEETAKREGNRDQDRLNKAFSNGEHQTNQPDSESTGQESPEDATNRKKGTCDQEYRTNQTRKNVMTTVFSTFVWLFLTMKDGSGTVIEWMDLFGWTSNNLDRSRSSGNQEENSPQWLSLTPARFRNRLINVPVRVTKGGRYRTIKIEETFPWAEWYEPFVRICWNPEVLFKNHPPP